MSLNLRIRSLSRRGASLAKAIRLPDAISMRRVVSQQHVPDALDPRQLHDTAEGSGAFGRWILDQAGLPAYQYELDQYKDGRACYANSENLDRRDHWHQIGNDHINAIASNDGTVQVYLCDRGGVFLNRFEARDFECRDDAETPPSTPRGWMEWVLRRVLPWLMRIVRQLIKIRQRPRASETDRAVHAATLPRGAANAQPIHAAAQPALLHAPAPHAYAGGFAYLDDGTEVWASAFRYRPLGAETRRVFGMGYYETEMTYRGIRLTRHIYAPFGDTPLMLIDVEIENRNPNAIDLCYYEYWDVNVHQLKLEWLRTGIAAAVSDDQRREINDKFTPSIEWDVRWQALRFHQEPAVESAQSPDAVSDIDWAPADIFLANLNDAPPAAIFANKATFFGNGGVRQPDAARERRAGDIGELADHRMPYCMVLRHDVLHLERGGRVTLRFAYGAARPDRALRFSHFFHTRASQPDTLECWKKHLAYFSTGQHPVLQREMAWHAYNLLSAGVYHSYYDAHLVPQGSAYLYLHGADGAPRDQALFVLPLTYLRPELARDTLRLIMRLTHATGGDIPYAFAGYGVHDGAGVHENPSDLDLFFLLAICEYIAATGDTAFLEEEEPFYPRGAIPPVVASTTVIEHVRIAALHLIDTVGIGEHGLIRIGDGDWSDSIVLETALNNLTRISYADSQTAGESVPNTQMALYVLPLAAALIELRDPVLAARLRQTADDLRTAAAAQWSQLGNWYVRAILRDYQNQPVPIDEDRINLEAQPWALISRLAADTGCEGQLIESIKTALDDPSPIGATLVAGGMVWPAISQLLTWGYTRSRPDLAWRSLQRNTFAAHAEAFPNIWINIWSGPDGVNSSDGGTWCSPLTPMTDFPVMNANQDAMALLGLLRVCGIEPAPRCDGLIIAPKPPPERFVLDLPLLRLDVTPGRIAGEYRAAVDGERVLYVRPPQGAMDMTASVNGRILNQPLWGTTEVTLSLAFKAGQPVPFEVRWNS